MIDQTNRQLHQRVVELERAQCEPVAWLDPDDPDVNSAFRWKQFRTYTIPLYASPPTIPEGYALVPIEPTEAMVRAAMGRYPLASDHAARQFEKMHRLNFVYDYKAMLAAATGSGK